MTTWVHRPGHPLANEFNMVEKSLAGPLFTANSATNVIRDEMDPTRHMATGAMVTSKHKFREMTRAAGCIEVGNDPAISRPRQPIQLSKEKRIDDIKRTIHELRNGR